MAKRPKGVTKSGGGVSLDISGDRELIAALSKVAVGVRTKILRAAMRKGMDVVTEAVRALAPVRTGKLRAAIETANGKTNSKWKVRVLTRPGRGLFKGDAFYAAFVEFGTKRMAARPFLTPGFDANKARALAVAREEILAGIEDEVWWASFRRTTIGRAHAKAGKRYRRAARSLGRARKATARSAGRLRKRAGKAARRTTRRARTSGRRLRKAAVRAATRRAKAARKQVRKTSKGLARHRKALVKRARKAVKPRRRRKRRR